MTPTTENGSSTPAGLRTDAGFRSQKDLADAARVSIWPVARAEMGHDIQMDAARDIAAAINARGVPCDGAEYMRAIERRRNQLKAGPLERSRKGLSGKRRS